MVREQQEVLEAENTIADMERKCRSQEEHKESLIAQIEEVKQSLKTKRASEYLGAGWGKRGADSLASSCAGTTGTAAATIEEWARARILGGSRRNEGFGCWDGGSSQGHIYTHGGRRLDQGILVCAANDHKGIRRYVLLRGADAGWTLTCAK